MDTKSQQGFTLPELVVVGIVLLLFSLGMIVVLRPVNYTALRNNAERRTELAHIMQAIAVYHAQYGQLPRAITAEEKPIATDELGSSLCNDLVPRQLKDLPFDPVAGITIANGSCAESGQVFNTGYTARLAPGGKLILAAPAAERGEIITVERWFPYL